MARQEGPIQIRGTVEQLNFFKRGNGYFLRPKTSVDSKRIKTDPSYQRTRENWQEFENAILAGKLLRDAIRPLLKQAPDPNMHNRMTKQLMEVVKGDVVSARGQRSVSKGPIGFMEGFEFNNGAHLAMSVGTPMSGAIDRASGAITLEVPSFVPGDVVSAPGGATHFKLISAGVLVDFETGIYSADLKESAAMVINYAPTADLTVVHSVAGAAGAPMMLIAGIQFMQEVNGRLYPLRNGAFNALRIMKVLGF